MTKRREGKRLLSIASREEWIQWINEETVDSRHCLFCLAYKRNCNKCQRIRSGRAINDCRGNRTDEEMIVAARTRLKEAGIL